MLNYPYCIVYKAIFERLFKSMVSSVIDVQQMFKPLESSKGYFIQGIII